MNSKLLFKDELIHPIIQIIGMLFITSVGYAIIEDFSNSDIQKVLIGFVLSIIIYSLVKSSKQVRIEKDKLIRGIYLDYVGFIYKEKSLSLSRVDEIIMSQKNDKYFHIIAKTTNDELLIIKEPNRFPAQKRLDLVRSYFDIKSE